jgi:hypothetical protein
MTVSLELNKAHTVVHDNIPSTQQMTRSIKKIILIALPLVSFSMFSVVVSRTIMGISWTDSFKELPGELIVIGGAMLFMAGRR